MSAGSDTRSIRDDDEIEGTATISEGHTLSVVERPIELGHRFTVTCTCGEVANTDYAFIANLVPTIHRMDLEAAAGG